jgi:hypothetical protein
MRPRIRLALRVAWLGAGLALAACRQQPTAAPTPAAATVVAGLAPTRQPTLMTATPPPTPTRTPVPSATHTPSPSPTPTPVLLQLTTGGCCVQPGWSPDGSEVWYLDRPSPAEPGGLWAVPALGGEPRFVTDRLGIYSPDRSLFAYPQGNQTYIESVEGERWLAPSGGRAISFSPDGSRIAWQVASSTVNFDRRLVELRVANLDGSEARVVATLRGGGLVDWLPDGQRMIVSFRNEEDQSSTYALLDLAAGDLQPLVEAPQLRGALLSPQAGWLAYQVTFSGDPSADGLWLLPLAGGEPRRLDVYGAYRWRAEGRLLVIPLEPGVPAQRVLEVDASIGETRALTDPAVTLLRIAGGDWALSPAGDRLAFVSADDRNLWILELPE